MATSLLAPGVLTQLQSVVLRTMPETVQILRKTPVSDGRGGHTDAWVQAGPNVICRVEPFMGRKGGTEEDRNMRFLTEGYWRLAMPAGTDVTAKDRVQISTMANRTLEVTAVDGPKSYEVEKRVFCVEVLQ